MTDFGGIGAAVIGTGFIGTVHGWALRRLGVRLEGVLGSSAARGADGARAMGVGRAYATLEELVADPKVDVVHVTSPNHAHFPQVRALLAAGKHVVCEKPLAMTSEQSAEMVRAREGERPGGGGLLQHALLSAEPAGARHGGAGRARRHPAGDGPLPPGLAVAGDRLELAARDRRRGRAARGRRHRHPLGGPDELHRRPAAVGAACRAHHLHPRTAEADRAGRDLLGGRRRDGAAEDRDRRRSADPVALSERGEGGGDDQPGERRAQERDALGHRRRTGLGRVVLRDAGPDVDRPPRPAEPGAARAIRA